MAYNNDEIRSVLVQTAGGRLLLPNASVAEVLVWTQPEALAGAPAWLLGQFEWHGRQVPLAAFAPMLGLSDEAALPNSRIVVLKALGGDAALPYFALLAQGFPRLAAVPRDGLLAEATEEDLPPGVHMRVLLEDETALLPDLDKVESMISQALALAA